MTLGPQFVGLAALISLTSCNLPHFRPAAADLTSIRSVVETAIHPLMVEYDVPGMAVAITIGGQALFFNYGVASKESATPVTEATLFELGSVSKTFTGTLAAYAHVLGKLSLDDHPGQYLPQLQGSALDQSSLLNLGTYTAGGLPLQFPEEVFDDERMIRYFRQWQPDAAPGVQRRYSNPSIGLLGYITGLVLEGDFAGAVETHLLAELGLDHSYIRVPERAMAHHAWGYSAANEPVRMRPGMFDAEAYGVKSSAADMIRFVQANIDPSPLVLPG